MSRKNEITTGTKVNKQLNATDVVKAIEKLIELKDTGVAYQDEKELARRTIIDYLLSSDTRGGVYVNPYPDTWVKY